MIRRAHLSIALAAAGVIFAGAGVTWRLLNPEATEVQALYACWPAWGAALGCVAGAWVLVPKDQR